LQPKTALAVLFVVSFICRFCAQQRIARDKFHDETIPSFAQVTAGKKK
jgi:hypothetical protein